MPTTPTAVSSFEPANELVFQPTNPHMPEKWLFLQVCTVGIFLAMTLLIFVLICQCLTSIRRGRQRQQEQQRRSSLVQLSLPVTSPLLLDHHRSTAHRISTISSTPSDTRSRCTETSIVMNTPLNMYPVGNSRDSTASSASYYMFPNEFEHLCK